MTLLRSSAAVVARAQSEPEVRYGALHGPDVIVCWASVTKVFVAGLCRALVDDGKLSWTTSVEELAGLRVSTRVTVEMLVEHRSGFPRMLSGPRAEADPYRRWTNDRFDAVVLPDLRSLVADDAEPDVEYSNLGYAVLVRCLERGLGSPWIELLRVYVLEPLGLSASSMTIGAPVESPSLGTSGAVRARSMWGRPLDEWDVAAGPFSGAGGLCSTVPAMVEVLARSLDTGSPLAPAPTRHAWSGAGPRYGHAGALLRSGSQVLVDVATGAVGAAHSVGGLPGHGDRYARRALARTAAASRAVGKAAR